MAAFLIVRLPHHPKSLGAVEFMHKNGFSYHISMNSPLISFSMSSGGGDSCQVGVSDELKLGKEEIHLIDSMTCIFPSQKVEANSRENSPLNENPASIECIIIEEDDSSPASQSDDRNSRLEIAPGAARSVEPKAEPSVATENPPMDVGQAEDEVVDEHQEEPAEETDSFLNQTEHDGYENVLLAEVLEFDESLSELLILPEGAQLEVEEHEESDFLDENEGEDREITVDELLEPLDEDDSTVALRPLRNNDVLLDFEGSLNDELQAEKEIIGGVEEDMEEFEEEEEELVEEQEHVDEVEENVDEQTEKNAEDLEKDHMDSDGEEVNDNEDDARSDEESEKKKTAQRKKKYGQATGTSSARLLYACFTKNCSSSFNTFEELEEHVKVHSRSKQFVCDVCKKKFSSKAAAMRHIQERKKKKCCQCGQQTTAACQLVIHHRCHTGEKPYVCKTCGKRFTQLASLNNHMLTHTGKKRFSCDVCKKSFALKQNLEVHKRSHSGEKPYSCGQCERRFSTGSILRNHVLTHSGQKRFECKDCGKKFGRRDHLNGHIQTHTREKPFSCKKCDAKFTHATSLKGHMKSKHS